MKDEIENEARADQEVEKTTWTIEPEVTPLKDPEDLTFTIEKEGEGEVKDVVAEEIPKEEIVEEVEKIAETPKEEEVKDIEIDDEKLLEIVAKKLGIEAKSFDDLKPKEQKKLNATVEMFQKFVDETNNDDFNSFMATQKDWSKEDENVVLRELLKSENPTLDQKEIDYLFKKRYSIEGLDEDFEDDNDKIIEKNINAKTDYQKGLAFLESQKEKYKVVRGSDENVPEEYKEAKALVDNWKQQQEEGKIAYEQNVADFTAKTDSVFSDNFEGFEVTIGENKFKVKPEDVNATKSVLTDLSNFDKMFFDEKTKQLKDPQGYYRALYFGHNAEKMAEHFYELGKASQVEDDDKISKNINVQGNKHIAPNIQNQGKVWKTEPE
jgi:hypothetical protein